MWPCLLIVLALLGRVPVSCSAIASPAVEAEEDVKELKMPEYSRCLGASDKQALGAPSMPGTATCRYVFIPHLLSFQQAENFCAWHYRGRLASIHDDHTNNFLLHMVRQQCNTGQVWIGAIPFPRCHWTDQSPWNYSRWLPGYPLHGHYFCTTLCTNSGLWRSVNCGYRLPFICEM